MEKVLLLQADDSQFIDRIAEKVAEKLKDSLKPVSVEKPIEKIYLTRKSAAEKLKISPPTLDQFVLDNIIQKLGNGKRARFRSEDVDNLFENLDKYYRRSRYKELKNKN